MKAWAHAEGRDGGPTSTLPDSAFRIHFLGNVKERAQRNVQWPSFLLWQHVLRCDCGQLGTLTEHHAFLSLEKTQDGDDWHHEETAGWRAPQAARLITPPWDVRSQGKFCGIRSLHAAPDPKVTLTSWLEWVQFLQWPPLALKSDPNYRLHHTWLARATNLVLPRQEPASRTTLQMRGS